MDKDAAVFAACCFRQLVQKCREHSCEGESRDAPRGSLNLLQLHSAFLQMQNYALWQESSLLHLCDCLGVGHSSLIHTGKPLIASLCGNPWKFLPFLFSLLWNLDTIQCLQDNFLAVPQPQQGFSLWGDTDVFSCTDHTHLGFKRAPRLKVWIIILVKRLTKY